MAAEWGASAHARAARSPLYRALRERAGDAACDRCHAPLAAIADEGVGCEVCHGIRAVEAARPGGGFTLAVTDVKRGPLCDAKATPAHRAGCSPLHGESLVCGGCHLGYRGELPVYTEYEEWAASAFPALGIRCQDCHMPTSEAEAARGGPRRDVPHHGLLGDDGALRRRALTMRAWLADAGGALRVDLALNNEGAGHSVPSGLPERRVVVRARVLDGAGREVAREERALGRVLVDGAGREAPSWAAARVASDERILAKATRMISFTLAGADAGEVVVEVAWQPFAPSIAARLGVAAPPEEPLLEARFRYGARRPNGGREGLPSTVWATSPRR